MIKIKWLGHACYKLEFNKGWQCVIDPFEDGYVPGYDNIQESADMVLCSHGHRDHSATDNVKILKRSLEAPKIRTVQIFHDDQKGALRGENIIHIFKQDGITLAHFGDIGHTLDKEQLENVGNIDIAILPIGGTYTVDYQKAFQIVNDVNAKLIIPMHYKKGNLGFEVIDTIDSFKNMFNNVVEYNTDTIVVEDNVPNQVAILKYSHKI